MSLFANVIYFAHGKESGPWGTKINRMAAVARKLGWHVESPDYSSMMDGDQRVAKLLALKPAAEKHLVFVGSSMGGYVSTVASEIVKPSGLFLLAPAFYKTGYKVQEPTPHAQHIAIVHGWNDEVISIENSIRFAKEFKAELHIVNSDHRLLDSLSIIEKLFEAFLDKIQES